MKLKPCPFCGGNPVMHEPEDGPFAGGVFIECDRCKASSVLMYFEKSDVRPLVAERWNTRSPAATRDVIPGVPAKHAIITDECRRSKGDAAVIEEALGRLRDEWAKVSAGWAVGAGGKFHVVLMVERPGPAAAPAREDAPTWPAGAESCADSGVSDNPPESPNGLVQSQGGVPPISPRPSAPAPSAPTGGAE